MELIFPSQFAIITVDQWKNIQMSCLRNEQLHGIARTKCKNTITFINNSNVPIKNLSNSNPASLLILCMN
jgi:hypothetical protein